MFSVWLFLLMFSAKSWGEAMDAAWEREETVTHTHTHPHSMRSCVTITHIAVMLHVCRAALKKNEVTRIRTFVENAMRRDPRIIAFKKKLEDDKKQKKLDKQAHLNAKKDGTHINITTINTHALIMWAYH